jgi:hypothetical protein
MRSSGGTKSLLDRSVVARTKSKIACLACPSFHDGSGWIDVWAFGSVELSVAALANVAVAAISIDRR